MKLLVITASVRNGREGKKVSDWFTNIVKQDDRFELTAVDLKELDLSYELPENIPGTIENGNYDTKEDREWAETINAVDGVVFVSPEYNHSLPASLKNAIDHLYKEWVGKPIGFVGYGAAGAPNSFENLKLVANSNLKMDLIDQRVAIPEIWAAFDETGALKNNELHSSEAKKLLDVLAEK